MKKINYLLILLSFLLGAPFYLSAQSSYTLDSIKIISVKLYQGQSGIAYIYATNTGNTNINSQPLTVFLSSDKIYDQADLLVKTYSYKNNFVIDSSILSSLPAGSAVRSDVKLDLKDFPSGKYYFIFKIGDANSSQTILSEESEILEGTVDLALTNLILNTDTVQTYGSFNYSVNLSNLNHGPVNLYRYSLRFIGDSDTIEIYNNMAFQSSNTGGPNGWLLENQIRKDSGLIKTGESFAGTLSVPIKPGNYRFEVSVTSRYPELVLLNNVISKNITVVPTRSHLEVLMDSLEISVIGLDTFIITHLKLANTGSMDLERAEFTQYIFSDSTNGAFKDQLS